MEKVLSKITEYNLFNYLLPGFVFIYIVERFYGFELLHSETLVNLFAAYFLGMVLSRVGSVIIEKVFKATGIVKYAKYEDYLAAEKEDLKLKILVQENNTYRTFVAVFFVLLMVACINFISGCYQEPFQTFEYVNLLLFIMFSLAYRKQTKYIKERVERKKLEVQG